MRSFVIGAAVLLASTSLAGCAVAGPLMPPPPTSPELTLSRAGIDNKFGNPIWLLSVDLPDGSTEKFTAVTGRAYSQGRDRNVSGLKAPLPAGQYNLGTVHRDGFSSPEIGGYAFIDLNPKFMTGRTDLGIHNDPSFDKDPVEDGTDGCVALTSKEQLVKLVALLKPYGGGTLTVVN